MNRFAAAFLAGLFIAAALSAATGTERKETRPVFYRPDCRVGESHAAAFGMQAASAVDTYMIVWYDFDPMNWQGWTRVDNTAQADTFFHVDDFDGLGEGSWGMLVPLEGSRSMWCGARPGTDPYMCSWENAPGYGNSWDQSLCTQVLMHTGIVTFSYKYSCDTELGYDYVSVIFAPGYNETEIARYYGRDSGIATHELFSASASFYLKFRFVSDPSYSDQDGFRDYDGAFIVDSITVSDESGLIDFEDFESSAVGETGAGVWYGMTGGSYGTYSAVAVNLLDKDVCADNFSGVIMFFSGSAWPSTEYPGMFDTPFCLGSGGTELPCQDEMVVSPPIDLTRYTTGRDEVQDGTIPPEDLPNLGGFRLEYSVYTDNPVSNLVFRTKQIRNVENGCPGGWINPGVWIPYEPAGVWWTDTWDISGIVTSDTIQVGLGVVDMCYAWYGTYGDCAEHTPAPWYDSVRIRRWDSRGPQWSVRAYELFQDTFPAEVPGSSDPMAEYCRADMAMDVAPGDELGRIDPGDSAVVQVAAPNSGGLDTLVTGEARVYMHCRVEFIGPEKKPVLNGPQLEGNYGSYAGEDGGWTVLLCRPAATSAGNIAPDKYCVDLNDSLFTRGYMIEYYFRAYDAEGMASTYPDPASTGGARLEFTCLPTLRSVPGALYVDDYDGRGSFRGEAQDYYDAAFASVLPEGLVPDRYDVNSPSSGVSNGIGAYVSADDSSSIFCLAYDKVIFDSGDLSFVTLSEGTELSDKSDDARLLADWMSSAAHRTGLLVMGDNIANDLSGSAAAVAAELMETLCGVSLESCSYLDLTGGVYGGGTITPLVTGEAGGPYEGFGCYVYGGCPVINDFDVLLPAGPGQAALRYPDYDSAERFAGILTDQVSAAGHPLRTVWAGFGFMLMRAAEPFFLVHSDFLFRTWCFLENGVTPATQTEIPAATVLEDNFPNPFNPVTRIKFALKEKGHVSLRVYDVAGRLVNVLVDEVRDAGSCEVVWDGANDEGRRVASGVYFCRMEARDYERTLKMVLLR